MRSCFAAVLLGGLCARMTQALPTSFTQIHIPQNILDGEWYKSKTSIGYQTCQPQDAPGVGFEFTTKYATVSVKYDNGTILDIGKIEGGPDYKKTMLNLWHGESVLKPPFTNPLDRIKYEYQQALRKSRKVLDLPATPDIGVLAAMLTELRRTVESKLGHPVNNALAAFPSLRNLIDGDVEESFEYAGITNLASPASGSTSLDWVNAAYAGMGYGLCENMEDDSACRGENTQTSGNQTLAISFDRDALKVDNVLIYNACSSVRGYSVDAAYLGYNYRTAHEFWERVASYIVWVAGKGPEAAGRRTQQIVLIGEYAEEKKFLDSLWKALHDLEDAGQLDGRAADIYSMLQVPGFNALYVGARGAAELALRWQREVKECPEA